ncbi:hypothetical protein GWI33_002631 [Rhynchophorus ferrugineus]|uniref:Uncharacterized protein n=1 Tax=Rhynchophorus ferrugineus TaxID=354439 RepID=A0A834HXJ0_RHYFE|nr:hypothetical protein GWI33_002631 [Rhynchophorus ferrugineus]
MCAKSDRLSYDRGKSSEKFVVSCAGLNTGRPVTLDCDSVAVLSMVARRQLNGPLGRFESVGIRRRAVRGNKIANIAYIARVIRSSLVVLMEVLIHSTCATQKYFKYFFQIIENV